MQNKNIFSLKRMLSLFLAVITAFSVFAVAPLVTAEAALNGPYEQHEGYLFNAAGNPLTQDEIQGLILQSLEYTDPRGKAIKDYGFGLNDSENPYTLGFGTGKFACAAFVTYVYSYFIGQINGYYGVQVTDDATGRTFNINNAPDGLLPVMPPSKSPEYHSYTKGEHLLSSNAVSSWLEFVENNKNWNAPVKCRGIPVEQLAQDLSVGSVLFYTREYSDANPGKLEDIPGQYGGTNHIMIYLGEINGVPSTVDCASGVGVHIQALDQWATKMGSTMRLVGYSKLTPTNDNGSITIKKTDENGNTLAGAKFELRDASGNLVDVPRGSSNPATTGADGIIRWQQLPFGTYTIKETAFPEGKGPKDGVTEWTVTISEGKNANVTVPVVNVSGPQYDRLKMKKVDSETNEPLAGAVFELRNADGTVATLKDGSPARATSGADGYFEMIDIPFGDYYLYETQAPPNHKIIDILQGVPIHLYGGDAYWMQSGHELPNTPDDNSGTVIIRKSDESGKSLAGAKFELRDGTGTVVASGTTNAAGSLVMSGLEYGNYTLVETAFPTGYMANSDGVTEWNVTISETVSTVSYNIKNIKEPEKAQIPVYKEWVNDNSATRPGYVTFALLEDGVEIDRVDVGPGKAGSVSGNVWSYTFKDLDPDKYAAGRYTVKEISVEGYRTTIVPFNGGFLISNVAPTYIVNKKDQRTTPTFNLPTFSVSAEKTDFEGGFDSDKKTARGEGSLAAQYNIKWEGTGGVSGSTTLTSDQWGSKEGYTFTPWSSIDQLTQTSYESKDVCLFSDVLYDVGYKGSVTVTVEEVVPEGYLDETKSGTGNGSRVYTFDYEIKATTNPQCSETVEEYEWGVPVIETTHVLTTDWDYKYTYGGSNVTGGTATTTASNTQDSVHSNQSIGEANFINRIQKGMYQLTKTYDKNLDPWSITVGQKEYINGSAWTLRMEDENGGDEGESYVYVTPINKGEPNYNAYSNNYQVVTEAGGVRADEKNPLVTNEYGQLNIYGLPYGKYILQEIQAAPTDGYVLETLHIDITSEGKYGNDFDTENAPPKSDEVTDLVKKNTIAVVKKDNTTGKTVPIEGTAFRIKYMGNPNTANNGGDVTQDPNYGRYLANGSSINDGYQYVFYTDSTGRITLPYELEYGLYQLEEIAAPEGYYIGKYGADGAGAAVDGSEDYNNTVCIFDANGNKVDYSADPNIVFNYYQFSVTEQESGEIVVQTVEMTDNSVNAMIEITKYGDTLVGFNETDSEFGKVNTPVYEMHPLPGAKFEIIAASDATLNDGYNAPDFIDADGNVITTEPENVDDGQSTYHATAPDGTEAHITTTRNTAPDGSLGEENKSNTITASLVTGSNADFPAAFYKMTDGTKVGLTRSENAVKTTFIANPDNKMPVIKYQGTDIGDYVDGITPVASEKTVDKGNGNYVHAVLDQTTGNFIVEVVSTQTGSEGGFEIEYYNGSTSTAYMTNDGKCRLDIVFVAKTLIHTSGKVVGTVTTDENGHAYSPMLPLGTYYVREVSSPLTYVNSANTIRVDLEYAGQFVPLVWGSATAKNESAKVTIDIQKSFQKALDSDEYEAKAGAVFGIYTANSISAKATAAEASVAKTSVNGDELMSLITIGDDGFSTVTVSLPFANNYYVKELKTLPGYTLPNVTYPFRVDEEALAEPLKLADSASGISGTVFQSDLFETTLVLDTKYQVPALPIVVNGTKIYTEADCDTDCGTAKVKNEALLDKAATTIAVKGTATIEFANGDVLTVTAKSDGYTVIHQGSAFKFDAGTVGTSTITEAQENGSTVYTYEPMIAYTGYAVDLTTKYNAPEFVVTSEGGVTVGITYDSTSGDRLLVLDPQKIFVDDEAEAPEEPPADESEDEGNDSEDTNEPADDSNDTIEDEVTPSLEKRFAKGLEEAEEVTVVNLDELAANGGSAEVEVKKGSVKETFSVKASIDSYEIRVPGAEASSKYGDLGSGLKITKDGDFTVISQKDETYTVVSEKGSSSLTAALNNDYSNAMLTLTGAAISAKDGTESIELGSGYLLSPGHTVTVMTNDEAVFVAALSKDGIMTLHVEGIVNGALSSEPNAPHAERGGSISNLINVNGEVISQKFPSTHNTLDGGSLILSQTLTYARSSNLVTALSVKINSTSENHMTSNDNATGRPDGIENDILHVSITKYDTHGRPLAGAVIGIYDSATNEEVYRGTTDETGKITWSPAKAGDFYYKEIETPSPAYELDTASYNFTLHETGTVTGSAALFNKLLPMYISKVDATTAKGIPGAKIVVTDKDGKTIASGYSDENGKFEFDRPEPGEYTFHETVAPAGYILNEEEFTFTINDDYTVTGDDTITNERIKITLHKIDATNAEGVPGAEIEILDESGTVIFTGTSDKNGDVTFDCPEPGTYTFHETVAPNGYILNEEEFTFTVNEDYTIDGDDTVTDKRTPVIINKHDATTGAGVPGAKIEVLDKDGKVIASGTSDADGKFEFERPDPGKYTFHEVVAPDGYLLNEETFTFVVNEDGTVTGDDTILDYPAEMIISKLDVTTSKGVPGAKIEVLDSNKNVIISGESDAEGHFKFNRPAPGTYWFHEVVAPDGYLLNEEMFTFVVKDDYTIEGDCTITDVPDKVIIEKTDAATGKPLQGATIEIYDSDNKLLKIGITDENGQLFFAAPKLGQYIYRESIAPEGYVLDESTHVIEIHSDGIITGTKFTNTPIVPKTGIDDYLPYIIGTGGLLLAALAIVVVIDRKRKYGGLEPRA